MSSARTTRNTPQSQGSGMTVDQKLDVLLSEVAAIKSDNGKFREDILSIKEDLKEFKVDINRSLEMCFSKVGDVEASLKECQKQIKDYEGTIDNLSSVNTSLKNELCELKRSQRVAEQYSRCNCLELWGVPETRQENILEIVKNVSHFLGFDFNNSMVDAAHRLAKNPGKPQDPRGIIVKFCRRIDMEALRARSRVKNGFSALDLGYDRDSKIYVNLSLSKETRVLWTQTRIVKERKHFKYAWITSAGKIFVRKTEGADAVLISEAADLDSLK